eukprot:9487622-Pyramimonas_sp.AAC.2
MPPRQLVDIFGLLHECSASQHQCPQFATLSSRSNPKGMTLLDDASVCSHDGPMRRSKRGYILTRDQSDAGSAGILSPHEGFVFWVLGDTEGGGRGGQLCREHHFRWPARRSPQHQRPRSASNAPLHPAVQVAPIGPN